MQDNQNPGSEFTPNTNPNTDGTPVSEASTSKPVMDVTPPASVSPESTVQPAASDQTVAEAPPEVAPGAAEEVEASESPAPAGESSEAESVKAHRPARKLIAALVVLLVLAGGAAAYHYTRPAKQVVASKDIPSITYAMRGAGTIKPYPTDVNTAASIEVNEQLFEGLVQYQDESKIVPLLASSWTTPNDNDWVFTLRSGVKFHSGRALTPQDVKYSLDYAVAHQKDQKGQSAMALASTIKSVAVTAPNQVTITTSAPDPTLLNRLTRLYIFDAKATVGDANAGTGPYSVQNGSSLGAQGVDLVATQNYWGGHVGTRAVHFRYVDDVSKLVSGLQSGQYDVVGALPSAKVAGVKSAVRFPVEDLGITFLGVNTMNTKSPMSNLAARQAVAYALNIPAILKAGSIEGQKDSQLVPPAIPGYDPSIQATPYDPAKAKELLATVPNAKTPITLTYPSPDQALMDEITKELQAVGFTVKQQPESDLSSLIPIALGGKTDMFYLTYTSDTLDGLDILSSIVTGNADYENADVDSLANQAQTTIDPTKRITLLQQIAKQVHNDVSDVPLYSQTRVYGVHQGYHFVTDDPNGDTGILFWKVHQE